MIRQGSQRRNCPDYSLRAHRLRNALDSSERRHAAQKACHGSSKARQSGTSVPAHRCTVDFPRARSTGYASNDLVVSIIPARAGFGNVFDPQSLKGRPD
jgi:hypothetical protein